MTLKYADFKCTEKPIKDGELSYQDLLNRIDRSAAQRGRTDDHVTIIATEEFFKLAFGDEKFERLRKDGILTRISSTTFRYLR